MIGRQGIHIPPKIVKSVLQRHKISFPDQILSGLYKNGFAEELFIQLLGADKVESIDASTYEGATVVEDLNALFNRPERYSAVVDCGTLEHCFHAPHAFTNIINLCEPGGHIIHVLPSNNYCGHGFYQFSPELFFSMYSRARGFEILGVYLAEEGNSTRWWKVQSPLERKGRVTLCNSIETHVLVLARKLEGAKTPAHESPHQSDYEQLSWRGAAVGPYKASDVSGAHGFKDWLFLLGIFDKARVAKRLARNIFSSASRDRGLFPIAPGEI
jgi:hypothetical protein